GRARPASRAWLGACSPRRAVRAGGDAGRGDRRLRGGLLQPPPRKRFRRGGALHVPCDRTARAAVRGRTTRVRPPPRAAGGNRAGCRGYRAELRLAAAHADLLLRLIGALSARDRRAIRPAPPADVEGADAPLVSVVIPCLNEEETIGRCVRAAREVLADLDGEGEVIVVDNDSEDESGRIAAAAGARVIHERRRGYGSAYLAGFAAARGRYLVMADADLTYDLKEIPHFVSELQAGAELVMGDRMDNIHPGAMPWLHRYVGHPVLTGILN